jgi:hypothetical protein
MSAHIYWLVLGLVLGGMLGMAYGFGKASLQQQVAIEMPGLASPGQRSTSSRVRTGWWASWLQGVSTEMVGAVVTTILLGTVVGAVQQQQSIAQQKQELILQMGSPDNAFAVEAARILRAQGWGFNLDSSLERANLKDANLQGATLAQANLQGAHLFRASLQGANLYRANLQEVYLFTANLQEANLVEANLQGAELARTDLQGANLKDTDLRGASLFEANLQEADLSGANLQEASLGEANLQGVSLIGAKYSEKTILPDYSAWTPDVDMTRFTDPDHPDFWRSANPNSPAYRGDN